MPRNMSPNMPLFKVAVAGLLVAGVFVACSSRDVDIVVAPSSDADAYSTDRPTLRLDSRAVPVEMGVRLRLDPSVTTFEGEASINLTVNRPIRVLWLNAATLTIREAVLRVGDRNVPVSVIEDASEVTGFDFGRLVMPGPAILTVRYSGKIEDTETEGVFRQKDGEDWYAYTQFESIDARHAFPCFDEPLYKIPWTLTIDAPDGNRVYANTPLVRQGESDLDGWTRFEFARSEPLPSYLVAFAVGPFDEVDAGMVGETPLRILTMRGKADRGRWAAEITRNLLASQERYTGVPYGYAKLDSISIPQTVGFGAMENVGLITYVEPLLLAAPDEETLEFRQDYASVGAHETAHMWFGDLVTPKWWDDIWLNESFATWLGSKTIIELYPEWEFDISMLDRRNYAMQADALVTARRVRQPIETVQDIHGAFDGISYSKGGTLLSAFENWIGATPFQRGIHDYLSQYAHKTATSADFLETLEAATRPGVAEAFSTFLDQSGIPVVAANLDCSGDVARVQLSQHRYLPIGSVGQDDRLWKIPICARWNTNDHESRACKLFDRSADTWELEGSSGCPSWVMLNDGGMGYYLTKYEGGLMSAIPTESISVGERLSLLRDTELLASGASVAIGDLIDLAIEAGKGDSWHLVAAAIDVLSELGTVFVDDDLREPFAGIVRETFGAKAHAVGFIPRDGEPAEDTLLRDDLISVVADEGMDEMLRGEALDLARGWLADRNVVPAESVRMVLGVAALNGGETLWKAYYDALLAESDRDQRERLIWGLTSFSDPLLKRKGWHLVADTNVDAREFWDASAWGTGVQREIALDAVRAHWETIIQRFPAYVAASMAELGSGFCSEKRRLEVESFFEERTKDLPNGPGTLRQTLEQISLCSARRDAQQAEFEEYLLGDAR